MRTTRIERVAGLRRIALISVQAFMPEDRSMARLILIASSHCFHHPNLHGSLRSVIKQMVCSRDAHRMICNDAGHGILMMKM